MSLTVNVNGKNYEVDDAHKDTPLLSWLRNHIGFFGVKYGCGIDECGACTVHIDGEKVHSCQKTIADAADKEVLTIEGFSQSNPEHPLLKAWVDLEVAQCGFCQPGMVMAAANLLEKNPNPNREEIGEALDGICRCAAYPRIYKAVERAAAEMRGENINVRQWSGEHHQSNDITKNPDAHAPLEPGFFPHPWVHVAQSGIITIFSAPAELGQGGLTAVAIMFAEEFGCDWQNVQVRYSPARDANSPSQNYPEDSDFHNPVYWGHGLMLTVGSSTTPNYYERARIMGAQARTVMMIAASEKWGCDVHDITLMKFGLLQNTAGDTLSYHQIAEFAKAPQQLPAIDSNNLKSSSNFSVIGTNIPRPDISAKTDGSALYSMDIELPEMLFARIIRPPVKGAKAAIFDDSKAREIPGIIDIVELPDGYGVIAVNYELAWYGTSLLEITWSSVDGSLFDDQRELEVQLSRARDLNDIGMPIQEEGDVSACFEDAAEIFSADFKTDFVYHAQLETLNAVAHFNDKGKIEVWVGTQAPTHCTRALAKEFNLGEEEIIVHRTYIGGGFGRRAAMDQDWVVDTARLAKAAGKPVKMVMAREDDLQFGRFKPISAHHVRAAIDKSGNLIGMHHRIVSDEALTQSDPWR